MNRDFASIAQDLRSLRPADFDEDDRNANGMERLHCLCEEACSSAPVSQVAPALLEFAERLSEAYLGSPGPVVHTLEAMPGYEPYLRASVLRCPTSLTLWMVNRIANARRSDRSDWVALLQSVAEDRQLPSSIREEARRFVEVQHGA